MMRRCPTE